jgi:hypothetical protein
MNSLRSRDLQSAGELDGRFHIVDFKLQLCFFMPNKKLCGAGEAGVVASRLRLDALSHGLSHRLNTTRPYRAL